MEKFDKRFFDELIHESEKYYAHSVEGKAINPELLSEHSALVVAYAQNIAKAHGLNNVIESLIEQSIPTSITEKKKIESLMHYIFWRAIAFHDIGKINAKFQHEKMHNCMELEKVDHKFGSQHSIVSVYLFLASLFDCIDAFEDDNDYICIFNYAIYMSYTIYMHHNSELFCCQNDVSWNEPEWWQLYNYQKVIGIALNGDDYHNRLRMACNRYKESSQEYEGIFGEFNQRFLQKYNSFSLYLLIRLCYSLLTSADYLATSHYKNQWGGMHNDFGIINQELRERIITNAQVLKSYNREAYKAFLNKETLNPSMFTTRSNANMNSLRKCMSIEVIKNTKKNRHEHLFYIEAPTGGGKTNLSMLAMAELLNANKEINKVYYVFPYTTLITQTYASLCATLGLEDTDIAEIHSKAAIVNKHDGQEESEYLNYLDNLFMSYPISLLSHVRFFDILKTNKKETNYALHRLANSIVIIDEVQSYSPGSWDKIMYFINNYAVFLNIRFILMSATLPKIGELMPVSNNAHNFVYLIDNKNLYFQNPNFANRVRFDFSLLEWEKPVKENQTLYLQRLCDFVCERSEEYAQSNSIYPNSVFTIVEFIFKKTASEFLSIVNNSNHCFDGVILLSGTILEPQRREIIKGLKTDEQRKLRTLLITTQVVEAGVDIDMDLGFKDKSIVDSEEQLAGRINRNAFKPECTLYLFDCNEEKVLYSDDQRCKLMKGNMDEYKEILETKDFDRLYDIVLSDINRRNQFNYQVNINELKKAISKLDFKEADKSLKLIDQDSISVFVPIDIPMELVQKEIDCIRDLCIPFNECLCGADVWDMYENIIHNQDEDFVKSRVKMKQLNSIMSLFVFNIFPKGKDAELLRTYGEEKYGYLYLNSYQGIYSLEDGINTEVLLESTFL